MTGAAPRSAAGAVAGLHAGSAHRRRVRALGVGALIVVGACVLIGAARRGRLSWRHVRTWYSEEVSAHLGLPPTEVPAEAPAGVPAEAPVRRPRVECSGLAVLVLDDHPVARRVAAALAADLASAAGGIVPVHDASAAAFAPGAAARVDVLALVDLVHFDAEDWFVYQRCQVRLNVAIGRPPRAVNDGREPVRRSGEVLDQGASFALEYSVDGHWELAGLAERGEHFTAAASSIAAGLRPVVAAVQWVRGDVPVLAEAAALPELPELVPAGTLQRIYEIVRPSGAREALLQVTTERDWIVEFERLEALARGLGWQRVNGALLQGGRPRATVLERAGERLEVTLAYMQGTLRAASEQRQVLTLLHRIEVRGR